MDAQEENTMKFGTERYTTICEGAPMTDAKQCVWMPWINCRAEDTAEYTGMMALRRHIRIRGGIRPDAAPLRLWVYVRPDMAYPTVLHAFEMVVNPR